MIVIVHHRGRQIRRVYDSAGATVTCVNRSAIPAFFELAERYPEEKIAWCEARYENKLKEIAWDDVLTNPVILATYACSGRVFLPAEIGLVDPSPFIRIKNDVKYPTWLMSSDLGGMTAGTLLAFKWLKDTNENLDYFLSAMAKIGMPAGLLCYSDPQLFGKSKEFPPLRYAKNEERLYDFVNDHFKKQWLFLLFLQQFIYQKKLPLLFLLKIFRRSIQPNLHINLHLQNEEKTRQTIDVLIPTLGRADYLHQVLHDLKMQTVLPDRVIIIEQNPYPDSRSSLGYLKTQTWPFEIIHRFVRRAGACNARNLALSHIQSDWVFFADDDIRIPIDFLERTNNFINTKLAEAFTVSCLREEEEERINKILQWHTFGSGCSFVKAGHLKDLQFDMAFEGGFGEDVDFGMQLRNKGIDVIYNPFLRLTHLKAPMGGFRKKYEFPWENEKIQPKPSPTIMALHLKHDAPFQLFGYKTTLFLKFFGKQKIKNPFTYFRKMQKRWKVSKNWAEILLGQKS